MYAYITKKHVKTSLIVFGRNINIFYLYGAMSCDSKFGYKIYSPISKYIFFCASFFDF